MTDKESGSTVPRRQLGRSLKDARGAARLTVKAAADALEWSEAKMWRIETGQTSMRSLDVEAMCRVYGVSAEMTEYLKALAKETKTKGWWHAYGDVMLPGFDVYIGLEGAASVFQWYEANLVPGLFQTADYARTLISYDNPHEDADEIERRVTLRMERQTLLTRATAKPSFRVVLDESILRRPVGGDAVMAGQMARLVQVAELGNVALRVTPFKAGLTDGILSGPFVTLRFPTNGDGKESEPPTVYVDGYTGDLYLDRPNEINRYDGAFARIWDLSTPEDESKNMLAAAAREYRS